MCSLVTAVNPCRCCCGPSGLPVHAGVVPFQHTVLSALSHAIRFWSSTNTRQFVPPTVQEAQCINKSLSALGDVISALQRRNAHIPFRNSKLTAVSTPHGVGTAPAYLQLLRSCPAATLPEASLLRHPITAAC